MHTYQDEKQEITERMHRHLINPQLLCKEPEYSLLEDLRRLLELALKEDDKKKEYCDLFYAVFSFFLQSTESCTAYFDKDNNLLLEQYKTGSTITCFEDYEGGSLKTRYIYDDGAAETGRKYIFMKKKISSTENIAIPAQKLLHDLIFQKNTKYTQTIYNRPIDKVKIDQLKKKSKDNNSPYLITRDKRYLYIDKWAGDSYNMVLDDDAEGFPGGGADRHSRIYGNLMAVLRDRRGDDLCGIFHGHQENDVLRILLPQCHIAGLQGELRDISYAHVRPRLLQSDRGRTGIVYPSAYSGDCRTHIHRVHSAGQRRFLYSGEQISARLSPTVSGRSGGIPVCHTVPA